MMAPLYRYCRSKSISRTTVTRRVDAAVSIPPALS